MSLSMKKAFTIIKQESVKIVLVRAYATKQCDLPKRPIKCVSPTSFKRGTGGRCSFNGLVATVFGASGFIGRYVCNKLGKIGTQLIIPYRGDEFEVRRLKLVGDLGQVVLLPFNLKDECSIKKAIKHSNVVINLIGRDWQTKNYKFKDVNMEGALRIARLTREMGIRNFIHVSSLNVGEKIEKYMLWRGSQFLQTKWKGEQQVKQVFPEATIIRPSDVYGQEDRFLKYFCHWMRRQGKWMPLYKKGETTEKQPVYVGDVAAGIVAICKDIDAQGKVYQFVGPHRYKLSDLVDWFYRLIKRDEEWGYKRYDIRFDPCFKMKVTMNPRITFGWPIGYLTWEQVEREAHSDKVSTALPTLRDLGIQLTKMEDQVPWELRTLRHWAYYDKEFREFDIPKSPPIINLHGKETMC